MILTNIQKPVKKVQCKRVCKEKKSKISSIDMLSPIPKEINTNENGLFTEIEKSYILILHSKIRTPRAISKHYQLDTFLRSLMQTSYTICF